MKKILFLSFLFAAFCFIQTLAQDTIKATKYYAGHNCGHVTADGSRINVKRVNTFKDRWVALSQDMFKRGYKMGDTIYVESSNPLLNGYWVIKDKMGPRVRRSIDFLMTRQNSKSFNKPCKVTITNVKRLKNETK